MLRRLLAAILPDRAKAILLNLVEFFREHTFRPYVIKKTVAGVTFNLLVSDSTAKRWYDNTAEWPEMNFLKAHLILPGDIVFECGGHHGCTTLFLARCVGDDGKVVTFEPSHENASIIEANMRLNGVANVVIESKAVGARTGTVIATGASNMRVAPVRRTASTPPGDHEAGLLRRRRDIQMVSLDDYAGACNLYPTLIKIDVEGYEVEVLNGARGVLKRRPKLAIEIHSPSDLARYGVSVNDLFALLDLDSYDCWIQKEDFDAPTVFDRSQAVTTRVHLYAVPRHGV